MQTIKNIKDMQALSRRLRAENKTIGFVPTMGALHEGHLSLIRHSQNINSITVVSIFINPIQFGPNEDLKQYPQDLKGDLNRLSSLNPVIVFTPVAGEMYPESFSTSVTVGSLGGILCGASRPGHFNGVATVVTKLFNIVRPDNAYFGRKDFQQTVIIKKLIKDLNFDINVIICPTVRELDGLAMSSRNTYLNNEERRAAAVLYRALKFGEELILSRGEVEAPSVKEQIRKLITAEPLARIDYVEIVDPHSLAKADKIASPVAICIAVIIGRTRLIDNLLVEIK